MTISFKSVIPVKCVRYYQKPNTKNASNTYMIPACETMSADLNDKAITKLCRILRGTSTDKYNIKRLFLGNIPLYEQQNCEQSIRKVTLGNRHYILTNEEADKVRTAGELLGISKKNGTSEFINKMKQEYSNTIRWVVNNEHSRLKLNGKPVELVTHAITEKAKFPLEKSLDIFKLEFVHPKACGTKLVEIPQMAEKS